MPQRTLVLRVEAELGRALEGRLSAEGFSFRPVPHAAFSARGAGVVATLYSSGKLVVQGGDPEGFAARFLEGAGVLSGGKGDPEEGPQFDEAVLVGSDESGKGDVFGPLVVAAVRLEPGQAGGLREGGVRDCKRMSDAQVRRVGGALQGALPCAVEVLAPPDYNAAYAELENLNLLLADLHARAIRAVARPGDRVLVDRFAQESLLEERLSQLDLELIQRPRAERESAVAAASVVAREAFLRGLDELSERLALSCPKGAGAAADGALRELVALHGVDGLGVATKVHFRNVRRLLEGEARDTQGG